MKYCLLDVICFFCVTVGTTNCVDQQKLNFGNKNLRTLNPFFALFHILLAKHCLIDYLQKKCDYSWEFGYVEYHLLVAINLLWCCQAFKGFINLIRRLHFGADILLHSQFLCWFFLSPKTDADTQSRVWRRPAPSLISIHTPQFSPHDAQRWEIINSTATEAQNHIHSDCHWLLLLGFEIYDDHLIMKFLSWYFFHKSKKKARQKARKAHTMAEIKNHLSVWLCNWRVALKGHMISL